MNILYFAPIRLWPEGHGNIATVHQFIKRLRVNGHKIHYVFFKDNNEFLSAFDLFYAQNFVDTLDVIDRFSSMQNRANRDSRGYYLFDSWYQDGLGSKISTLCSDYHIDVIICTYVMQSKILNYVPNNILKIIDTHDRMTDRHLSLISNNIRDEFFSCTKDDEAKYLLRADIIWARTDNERDFFNEITKSRKAITVSHFNNPNFLKKTYQKMQKIGFLASDNNVNAKMVQDFVYSFINNHTAVNLPIEIVIGGNVYKILEKNHNFMKIIHENNISFLGAIDNVESFYQQVDVVIVPVTFGTGINVKMIEALSFGVPLISTKCGVKGLEIIKSEYHSAECLEDLVRLICKLYANPKDLMSLQKLSEDMYVNFYKKNIATFDQCFKSDTM
ncbi:glycosyltransferase [Succinatimonas hippei]|uniref:glycosyltransferase n=1 Tax=Succinatimonas hippei TaxID=626938 RepID=UPI0025A3B802|nr:glycosyltransferase [Succinatimonas hippei]MDM8119737.1 glycosyltransferase [Succinatimonas hippei]